MTIAVSLAVLDMKMVSVDKPAVGKTALVGVAVGVGLSAKDGVAGAAVPWPSGSNKIPIDVPRTQHMGRLTQSFSV